MKQSQTFKLLCKGGIFLSAFLCTTALMAENNNTSVETNKVYLSQQKQKTIIGTVKDSKNQPLAGVGVTIKNTRIGTTTDLDGNFVIKAEEGQILVLSCLGFKDKEVLLGKDNSIEVVLSEDNKLLEEVVVIGYGTSRKQDLSTSISTVKVDNALRSRPATLGSYLQGIMPGVVIQSNGGDPLKEQSLTIRGRGSRGDDNNYNSGDGVLFVVDGVPNAPFNMEDVESISVLKDAASAAIYGASVGSGGVVVITTKQANAGKIKVNINIQKSFKSAWRLPQVLTAEEYNSVWEKATQGTNNLPAEANPSIFPFGAKTRTNWIDSIFRTGQLEHYGISLSGGSEYIKAFASISYDNNKGILLNTYSKVFGSKINLDFKLNNWLNIVETLTYRHKNGQGDLGIGHQGVLTNAVLFPRSANIYDQKEDGSYYIEEGRKLFQGTVPRWAADKGLGGGYGELRNPVATLMRLDQQRPYHVAYSTTSLIARPTSNLVLKSSFTAGYKNKKLDEFIPRVLEIGRKNEENSRNIHNTTHYNWLWESTATYSNIFNDVHRLSAMVGYTMKYDKNHYMFFQANKFDREDRHSTILDLAESFNKDKPREAIQEESLISGFGRVAYSYADRYFITASLRYDATSKLWKKNNYGIFPAISGSWKVSSEPFFASVKPYINLLKFRASFGQVGNVNLVPAYSWNVPLGVNDYKIIYGKDLDNVIDNGVYNKSIITKSLRWETTEQLSIGMDMALFNNALTIGIDYFDKKTKDLIERVPVTSVSGIEVEPYGNIGKVLNRGFEFNINYNQNIGEANIKLFGNLSTVTNKVLSLGPRNELVHKNNINGLTPLRSSVGQPWYSYYILKTDGIFQNEEEIKNYKWTDPQSGIKKIIQQNAVPGDLKFVDTNNDGQINSDDCQYLGSYIPTVTYGFGATLNYKGFDFNILFQGVHGNKIFNGFKQIGLTGRQQGGNMLKDILKSWDYDKKSNIPRLALIKDENGNFSQASDFYLEDGSYLRLKNITLGYTISQKVLDRIGLQKNAIRIYLTAENLLTFTKYSGLDPEVGNFGIDGGIYPVARGFGFGINLNF